MSTLTICVTVDWDGMELIPESLLAMGRFREAFPEVPLTHFICPSYLTRDGDNAEIAKVIREHIQGQDEVALHIHCWRSLVEASGVEYIPEPSWYLDGIGPKVEYGDGRFDIGHGVPLGVYPEAQIIRQMRHSIQLLRDFDIAPEAPVSFRGGGWMASDVVLTAMRSAGLHNDSSATDSDYFEEINEQLEGYGVRLGEWVCRLWGPGAIAAPPYSANTHTRAVRPEGGHEASQPYVMRIGEHDVFEVPDNGVLADYLTETQMYDRFQRAWASAAAQDTVHVCGFHEESAAWPGWNDEERTNLQNLQTALHRFVASTETTTCDFGKAELAFSTIRQVAKKSKGTPALPRHGSAPAPFAFAPRPARRPWG